MGQASSGETESMSASELKSNNPDDEITNDGNNLLEADFQPQVSSYGNSNAVHTFDQTHTTDQTPSNQIKIGNNRKRKVSSTEHVTQRSNMVHQNFRNHQSGIEKPAFRVSAFVSPSDHYSTSFNTSLNSSSFDFTGGKRSTFYSGQTKFGGSTTVRETAAKRMKIEPVSNSVRTTRTQINAKPLRTGKKNTITSETAKKILSTLDRMSAPVRDSRKMSYMARSSISTSQTTEYLKTPVSKLVPPTFGTDFKKFSSGIPLAKSQPVISQKVPNLTFTPQGLTAPLRKPQNILSSDASKLKSGHEHSTANSISNKIKEPIYCIAHTTTAVPFTVNSLPSFTLSSNKSISAVSTTISNKHIAISQVSSTDQVKDSGASIKNVFKDKAFPVIHTVLPQTNTISKTEELFAFSSPGIIGRKTNQIHSTPFKTFAFSTPNDVKNEKDSTSNKLLSQTGNKTFKTFNFVQKKPAGSWDCPTCMIVNKSNDEKCVACAEPKPVVSSKGFAPAPDTKVIKTLNFVQKKPAGSWDCPVCMIVNKSTDEKCVACTEPKRVVSSKGFAPAPDTKVIKTLNFVQKKPAGSWDCPVCMIVNKSTDEKCVACAEPKPVVSCKGFAPAPDTKVIKTLNFVQKKPAGSWDCPVCMIINKVTDEKCVACTEPKPKSDEKNATTSDSSVNPAFMFGSLESKNLGISFGAPANAKDPGFSFSTNAASSGFSFGSTNTTFSSGFSFGAPTSTSNSGISVGAPGTTSSSGFSFGATSASNFGISVGALATTSSSGFSFGAPATTSSSGFSFGDPATSSSSGFSFGAPAAISSAEVLFGAPATTSSSFGAPATTSSAEVLFGAPATTSSSFGAPATTSSAEVLFGAPATTSSSFGAPATTSSAEVLFGAPATTSSSFGAPATTSSAEVLFGAPATTSSSLGAPATTSSSKVLFGAPATTSSSGISFDTTAATSSSGFSFGAPAAISSSGFSFGAPVTTTTGVSDELSVKKETEQKTTGFSFGSKITSGFSFDTTNVNPIKLPSFISDTTDGSNKDVSKSGFNLSISNSKSLDNGISGKCEFGFNSSQTNGNMAGFSFGLKPVVEHSAMNAGLPNSSNPAKTSDSSSLFNFGAAGTSLINASEKPTEQFKFNPQFSTGSLFNFGSSGQSTNKVDFTIASKNTNPPQYNMKNNTTSAKTSTLGKARNERRIRRRLQRP